MNLPKVVTHPLGLAGYALALLFGLLSKFGPSSKWPWLVPVAVAMAFLCAGGGLLLASRQISANESSKGPLTTPTVVKQESRGAQSPNVANTGGPVHIEYGSASKASTHKKS